MPSNPFDAKGLLAAAIQDDNPVIFLGQRLLFFDEPTPVPEERYAIELSVAKTHRVVVAHEPSSSAASAPRSLRTLPSTVSGTSTRRSYASARPRTRSRTRKTSS
jgi:pyruvate/2-oxoglutarate/acetoin dehydrogenase E1 component